MPNLNTAGLELLSQEFSFPEGTDPGGRLALIWAFYVDKALRAPRMQYLYAKRHIVQFLQQQVWPDVTWAEAGVNESDGQKFDHLNTLYASLTAEIALLEKVAAANRGGRVGALTATAPITATGCQPDPNSRVYRGDPLLRR